VGSGSICAHFSSGWTLNLHWMSIWDDLEISGCTEPARPGNLTQVKSGAGMNLGWSEMLRGVKSGMGQIWRRVKSGAM